jgi:hypothetical protein
MTEPRLAVEQFTREEAIEFAQTEKWKDLTPEARGILGLRQELLCMPFAEVHGGVTAMLGRPVYTHEFADPDALWNEFLTGETISFEDVIAKIPERLRGNMIVLEVKDDG